MKTGFRVRILCVLLLLAVVCTCSACGQREEKREPQAIIEEMVVDYGSYGSEAEEHIQALLKELRAVDGDAADRWNSIMSLWKRVNTELTVQESVLPDGLPDTDELCLVALGFQLNPDGSMRDELIERLKVQRGEIPPGLDRLHRRRDGGGEPKRHGGRKDGPMADRKRHRGGARPGGGSLPHHGAERHLYL